MRQPIEIYHGKNTPTEVFSKMNYIAKQRNHYIYENITNIKMLCDEYNLKTNQTYIVIGQDWYIIYYIDRNYVEILEWYSIESVEDKFAQTIEMLKTIREILLLGKSSKVISCMKLTTSYKFYRLFLERGYLKEYYSYKGLAELDEPNDMDKFLDKIYSKYETIEEYLNDSKREIYLELEPYFFCEASFQVTNKFKKRYSILKKRSKKIIKI